MIFMEIQNPREKNMLHTFNGKLKIAHIMLQALILFYTCVVNGPKMTFLNVLDCMFLMFFLVLSTSSMIISVCSKTSHQFFVYETGNLFSMIMSFGVIHLCRSKIFLTKHNVKSLSDLFMYSQTESIECYFAPPLIILSQILCLALFSYKENISPNLSSLELVNSNCSCENISGKFYCAKCNRKLKENEGLSEEFDVLNGNKLEQLNAGENILTEKVPYEIGYSSSSSCIDNKDENKPSMESEEKFNENSSNVRKKLKPPPRLYRVPSNSSNANKELDSTNSEIASHNDTCLSTLDTEDDISLSTIRMDTSESFISEISLTDSKQFLNVLNTDSISLQNTSSPVHKSSNTSVQFPMDLTPENSEFFTFNVVNLADNESSSQLIDYSPSQRKYEHTLKGKECSYVENPISNYKWKILEFESCLRKMYFVEDSSIKEIFLNAVASFEKENSIEFFNWLSAKQNSSEEFYTEFLKFVNEKYRNDVKKILSELKDNTFC